MLLQPALDRPPPSRKGKKAVSSADGWADSGAPVDGAMLGNVSSSSLRGGDEEVTAVTRGSTDASAHAEEVIK